MSTRKLIQIILLFFSSPEIFAQDTKAYRQLTQQAATYYHNRDYLRSAQTLELAINLKDKDCGYIEVYNAACAWSLAGQPDKAFKHLNYLASAFMTDPQGYLGKDNSDPMTYITEKDFYPLHTDKRWNEFIARLQKRRKPLVNTLDSIRIDDQYYRSKLKETEKKYGRMSKELDDLWKTIHLKDSLNLVKVKAIIDKHGWPGIDSVGKRGNSTIFLVIQHSDLKTQQHYLPIMREAVKNKKAVGADLALLEDRVALAEGRKQIYGSQVGRDSITDWHLLPLENPDSVDIRRRSVGLGGLYFYLRNWDITWNVEEYKKQVLMAEKKQVKQ